MQSPGGLLKERGQGGLGWLLAERPRSIPALSTAQALVRLCVVSPSELSSLFAYLYIWYIAGAQ